uniref:RING-type domain-containing protein n=1 Tax=Arcella intermedia TaxID=1963864 RepID=A0A6B2LIJ0_9EUKA
MEGVGTEVLILWGGFICLVGLNLWSWLAQRYPTTFNRDSLRPRRLHLTESCPICLESVNYAIATNCGHQFCGNCISRFLEHSNYNVSCPICRCSISVLIENFLPGESNTEEGTQYIHVIDQFNRNTGVIPRTFEDYIRDSPVMITYYLSFLGSNSVSIVVRIRQIFLLVFLLYFISPFDLIPESMFDVLALIHDLVLLLILILLMRRFFLRMR